jgi:acylphosphatase
MKWTVDRREGLSRDDMPERVQEWLDANGHPGIEVISTAYNPHNGNVRIVVESENDPTEAIMEYVPTPSTKEVARAARLAAGRDVAAKARTNPNAPRTPQEINAFIDAVAELLPELQGVS